ncbi:nucleosome assembly protein 1;2-like isoform X2 [Lycium barbarum]|uniref:nucleosome assembly protein 1;2-like isoform X2 n=1 Tax=Lycium barbarum TaxID=112863 RepID=UPI00293E3264|nr:nucleosome assembly protein 1;2-like isoform X2 [Lycium barbarum]
MIFNLHDYSQRDALKALYSEEKAVLEAKYEKLHESLYPKRYEIVNGVVEVKGVDLAPVDHSDNKGTGDEKGVPNFWLTALKSFAKYEDEIYVSKRDKEALKFLKDIKWCRVDHPKGFKLDFFFDTNPFFKNSVLTKTCHKRINKAMPKNTTGTDIEWFPGKCLTKKTVKCNPDRRLKSAKTMIRPVDCESFFHFFKPPLVGGPQYHMQEDDYEIGSTIRDKIIPDAVLWFTGEAEEDDSIYMEFDMDAYEDAMRWECGMISRHVKGRDYIDEDYGDMYMECNISRHVKGHDNIEEDDDDDDDVDDDDEEDDNDCDSVDDEEDEYACDYDGVEEEEEEKPEKKVQVQHRGSVAQVNGVAAATATGGATSTAAPGGVQNQFKPMSLYVGDLDFNVTDTQLYELFNQAGQVVSVRLCRDLCTRRSLGYGFVNYSNPQDAAKAMEMLDYTPVNGKSIRVKHSYSDPTFPKSRTANLFVRNLDRSIDSKALHDTFSSFGDILSCKVVTDSNGQSKCYGFVQFDNDESAQSAIDKLNGALINDRQVYVSHALHKEKSGRAQAR